ncbi:MAG: energy-coupling factor transporter ATPase [Ruminococcaceae bacterium]|nr:energy-coupling factor transporter ATPase [Oscillospiraceae bacterium]
MEGPFIRTEGLSYLYEDESATPTLVLKDISLQIEKGEFVAILGHNGSGKSTLAKLLNMILVPTAGKIYVGGKDITADDIGDEDMLALRRSVGMVFQNPDNQLVATIVEDDVAFGPENLGIQSAEIRKRVDEVLSIVGMTDYAKHEPHRLSGGQKQRIAIAGVLAMLPECIIFDESTAMLDPLGRKDVMNAIEKLNREMGITVIMITHYMDEAARADRIIVLDDGRILFDGTPSYVFEQEETLKECGLAIPQCTELIHRMRDAGVVLDGECVTLEDCVSLILNSLEKQ